MRWLLRVWKFITRGRALGAWLMFVIAIAVYLLYPAGGWAHEAFAQGSLIVASIGLSTIFLPELSSNLWTLKSSEISSLVPEEKVRALQRSIVESQVDDPNWSHSIVDDALVPLVNTRLAPHQVVFSTSYSVTVHPDSSALFAKEKVNLAAYECHLSSKRCLPRRAHDDVFWVTLARDSASLHAEYHEPGCIYREVAEIDPGLSDEAWQKMVGTYSSARVIIDGTSITATRDAPYSDLAAGNSKLVRWYFTSPEVSGAVEHARRIDIYFDYIQNQSVSTFPALFSSYYLADGLRFVFNLQTSRPYTLTHESFLAYALPHATHESVVEKAVGPELLVVTSDSALIWPGSGIYVSWHPTSAGDLGLVD